MLPQGKKKILEDKSHSKLGNVIDFLFSEKSLFEYGLVNHALSAAMQTLIKVSCEVGSIRI